MAGLVKTGAEVGGNVEIMEGGAVIAIAHKDYAAFIARACNSYDDLIEMAKSVMTDHTCVEVLRTNDPHVTCKHTQRYRLCGACAAKDAITKSTKGA